jgi:hypothetical protein
VPVDLQDLEARLSGVPSDVEKLDLLAAATQLVEAEVGPLTVRTATETLDAARVLNNLPVQALTAATYGGVDVLAGLTVSSAGVVAGARAGTVVTYTYGRPGPTAIEREVILEVARRALRSTQQGYRPGYGDGPESDGLPPALLLTRADREGLAATRIYRGVVA